ncbi:MAG TPA: xanthine dehydrogenase family protein molybdopterin-binding subunit [Candidatus Limnocylindria bacterium]|nr:xanthine dehydrogenase family protein molybdopterin-binding subunit [Candidatus Limnocylindria bacterium]
MSKTLSTQEIIALLDDTNFLWQVAEWPDDHIDEVTQINEYLRSVTPQAPAWIRAASQQPLKIVGTRQRRYEDPARLMGQALYSSDIKLPGMLYTAILPSPHAHALIEDIDTSAAGALPGVRAILTYKNAPKTVIGGPPDQFLMNQEVHFAGEEVAWVAADDIQTAREATRLIKVQYKVLPSISDVEKALAAGAPDIVGTKSGNKVPGSTAPVKRGNFDTAYASAATKHEGRYTTETLQHMYLEPRASVARWEGPDRLVVWTGTQYVAGVRNDLAGYFNMPRSHVRVICENVGGGFGAKSPAGRQARAAAVLAQMTAKPVRVVYDRPTDMRSAIHRFADIVELKAGVDKDGKLVAYKAYNIGDAGAYNAGTSALVPITRLYRVPNALFEFQGGITNRGPSGAQRCVGDPQGTWCQEIFMDELAEKAGIDPVEFRLRNFETERFQTNNLPWASCGIVECVQRAAKEIGWTTKWHKPAAKITGRKAHGIGMAAHSCAHGSMSVPMTAMMRLDRDGSLDVNETSTEHGGGEATVMTMIAAETLGIPLSMCQPHWGDAGANPDSGSSGGSKQTIGTGNAMRDAALDLKAQLLTIATSGAKPMLAAKPEDCDTADGYVFIKTDPSKKVAFKDVVASTGNPLLGTGAHTVPPGWTQGTFSAGFAEVEVDLDTGELTLLRYVLSNDVGKAVNVLAVEQQMEGGASMAIGMGIGEEIKHDPQANFPVHWNWENYAMPTTLEHPKWADFKPIIVEPIDALGPFGAKGVGEPPTAPPPPAIANALYNAIGVRIHDAPITRDKILAAIAKMK